MPLFQGALKPVFEFAQEFVRGVSWPIDSLESVDNCPLTAQEILGAGNQLLCDF
ncbi:MAG: hypothetical protein ABIQ86_02415 [Steroidobacteraceae bacterium]